MTSELIEILGTSGVVITALGGFECVKWFINRKAHKVVSEEEAKQAKIDTKNDTFHHLQERIQFAESQLVEKEKRFSEQTALLRDTNRQLLDSTIEIGTLKAEISALKAERAMKLCEKRMCKDRQPQSGY